MSIFLSNNQLSLRPLEPEDLQFLYDCENDTGNWHVSNTVTPFSKYILKQYIESSAQDIYTTKQLRLIIESTADKKPVGAIDLFDFDPYHLRAGVGIVICEQSDKMKGYASGALSLLIHYCFSYLNLHQLYCNIGEHNQASLKLFAKAGFIQTGEKKGWLKTSDGWESEFIFQLIEN